MTLDEALNSPHNPHHHHHLHHHHSLMDWLEDSISILPSFINEPYSVLEDFIPYDWWVQDQTHSLTTTATAVPPISTPLPDPPKTPKKRKLSNNISKKPQPKNTPSNSTVSKEARWAEQLLNPLSSAIQSANLSRAQHLIYVLQELASPTGDANHRLAFYGLQSLSRTRSPSTPTFATTDPRLFRSALIKFHEVSAWFAFPNCIANAAIMQAWRIGGGMQLVDAGVSHGLQWPTLMEAMGRRGEKGMVRMRVVEEGNGGVFGRAPKGYDFVPQLMRYARSIELGLRVERGWGRKEGKEVVVVCVGYRMGRVGEGFWEGVRDADLVVVTEMEEGGGFGKRAEMMWRYLESTGVAFKGKESEERRVVEGEGARMLEEEEGEKGRWRERMGEEGFEEKGFGEEVVEAGKALLKKYDGNWEMRSEGDGGVGLCWKGQVVVLCSVWKPVGCKRR